MRKAINVILLLVIHIAVVSGNGLGKLRGYSESHSIDDSMVKDEEKVLEDPSLPSLLGRCQEGCHDDSDCDESLKCFQYSIEGAAAPGCNTELLEGDKKYCYDPSDEVSITPRKLRTIGGRTIGGTIGGAVNGRDGGGGNATQQNNTLTNVDYNGSPNSSYPLQKCQGDCNTDDDCEGELQCKFRSGSPDLPVPGCDGQGISGDDYCHDPADPLLWDPWPPEAFRLRLYWEQGYNWQGNSTEAWWCMECWNGCDVGEMIFMKWCDMENTRFVFVNGTVGRVQIQVGGTNLCLEFMNRDKIQVQVCDPSKTSQWFESQMGSFNNDKFDIRPIVQTDRCLTQQHHPKENEIVYAEKCGMAHADTTGYWNKLFI